VRNLGTSRHCERSEAIQGNWVERLTSPLDCFVASLLASTINPHRFRLTQSPPHAPIRS